MDAPVAPVRPRGNGPKPPPSFSAVDLLTVSGEETCLQVKHPGVLEKGCVRGDQGQFFTGGDGHVERLEGPQGRWQKAEPASCR